MLTRGIETMASEGARPWGRGRSGDCYKSHNAAMSPLATQDGHRKRKRKRSDAVH